MSGSNMIFETVPNPAFVIDEKLFIKNMEVLNTVMKASGCEILCALKGFSFPRVFPVMSKYLSGGTASSLNEAKLVNEFLNQKAHSCFVVYTDEEFDEVNAASSHLTFNSWAQFDRFKHALTSEVNYAVRINPEYSNVEFEQYNPCMPGSRFGITIDKMPKVLPPEITGLHMHTLCESSAEDFAKTIEVVETKCAELIKQVKWVNFGGGHHITKPGYNIELLIDVLNRFQEKYKVKVIIEPGEAIGLNAGYLVTQVEDVVESKFENTAILNASFSAHMPDCLEMPYKPKVIGEDANGSYEYTLGGNTCMSGDFVKGFKFKKPLQKGDLIVFEDMAHYTFVKTSFFNGVVHPCLGIVKMNGEFELLKSFTYEDFKHRLS